MLNLWRNIINEEGEGSEEWTQKLIREDNNDIFSSQNHLQMACFPPIKQLMGNEIVLICS